MQTPRLVIPIRRSLLAGAGLAAAAASALVGLVGLGGEPAEQRYFPTRSRRPRTDRRRGHHGWSLGRRLGRYSGHFGERMACGRFKGSNAAKAGARMARKMAKASARAARRRKLDRIDARGPLPTILRRSFR
jgi:hypothetical protein